MTKKIYDKDVKEKKQSFYADNRVAIKSFFVIVAFLGAFAWANLGLNVFAPGEVISSAKINQNFQKLEDAINKSDLSLENTSVLTVVDTGSCKSTHAVLLFNSPTGISSANYNPSNGEFSFPEGGLYHLIYKFKCDSCSKRSLYLCADADQGSDCMTEGKPVETYITDANTSNGPADKYIEFDSNKVYRLIFRYMCNDINFQTGNAYIYFKKIK